MYQEAEFATNIQTGKTTSDINENQPKHQNRNFLKDFLQLFVMKFVYYLHLTSYLISQ